MATILVKGLKDPVKARIKELAEIHNRSMNQEVVSILEAAAKIRTVTAMKERYKFSKPISTEEITAIIRHDRDHGH